jgi:hypothetical protein
VYLKEHECNDGWWMGGNALGEVERAKEGWGMQECREKSEDGEDMKLGYAEELRRVEVVPVPELMR